MLEYLNKTSSLTLNNGPMKIVINNENYNKDLFSIDPETRLFKFNDKPIESGDFYKVEILTYRIINKEKYIFIIGKLIDSVSENVVIIKKSPPSP